MYLVNPQNVGTRFGLVVTVKPDLVAALKCILGKQVILQKKMLGLE